MNKWVLITWIIALITWVLNIIKYGWSDERAVIIILLFVILIMNLKQ